MHPEIKFIEGGITAAEGFSANAICCHIKKNRNTDDTALIHSDTPCTAAGLFTQNRVKAEPVKLSIKNISNGDIRTIIANSGNANCCTGKKGADAALRMAELAAKETGCHSDEVAVFSTGVIGADFPIEKIEENIHELASGLSKNGNEKASRAIMTTDTKNKECAVEFILDGKKCRIGSMCKGSGMIHINLGTMLSFITTDVSISEKMLRVSLEESAKETYNCVSVDGDTSTNDSLVILANGKAGNKKITDEGEDFRIFLTALNKLNRIMAMKIAADGEGATRLVQCTVEGAKTADDARSLAKAVISSSLVKAAMFGCDANFGRFLCAMGYSGTDFSPEKTSIWFSSKGGAKRYFDDYQSFDVHGENSVLVYKDGKPEAFDEEKARKIMGEEAVEILVRCKEGNSTGTAWGCDLSYDYVKINGDYRT